jgi:hypothetical protein
VAESVIEALAIDNTDLNDQFFSFVKYVRRS